jgi:hypothetical protein
VPLPDEADPLSLHNSAFGGSDVASSDNEGWSLLEPVVRTGGN